MAKAYITYDVSEIAVLYSCHRNTVRHWLRVGLEAIDEIRPTFVRGDALNEFHSKRRAAAKRPCEIGEIFCPPCGAAKRPFADMVDVVQVNEKIWKVAGLCPDCERQITQRVGVRRLEAFRTFAGFVERGADDE